jgi:hypothetical protein
MMIHLYIQQFQHNVKSGWQCYLEASSRERGFLPWRHLVVHTLIENYHLLYFIY